MALTQRQAEEHVSAWTAKLRDVRYPHREKWPSRLFHHSPLENAEQILRSGTLRSRNDPENKRERDVAAEGVIINRRHAHDACRLYFRPNTPTQYHIEGIRKEGECDFGESTHAPVLFMFVFHAVPILTRNGTLFCDRNMQRSDANPRGEIDYFLNIPFEKVYHEGPLSSDASIKYHRCAEVLATSPIQLKDCLQWVYCRSAAERQTLIHKLGHAHASKWQPKLIVSDDLKVFQRRFAFVEHVSASDDGVTFRCNDRYDRQKIDVRLRVWDARGALVIDFHDPSMAATPNHPYKNWLVSKKLKNGRHRVQMKVEGHLGYEAVVSIGPTLV